MSCDRYAIVKPVLRMAVETVLQCLQEGHECAPWKGACGLDNCKVRLEDDADFPASRVQRHHVRVGERRDDAYNDSRRMIQQWYALKRNMRQ